MGIFSWLVLGAVAGYVAKWLMPNTMPESVVTTVGIGIAGALVGRFIAGIAAMGAAGGFGLCSIIVAVLGTLLLLTAYRKLSA